jgi:hypothetical protein
MGSSARPASPLGRTLLTLLGLLLLSPAMAPAAEELVFGPVQYTRTSGPPNQFTASFTLPPPSPRPTACTCRTGTPTARSGSAARRSG